MFAIFAGGIERDANKVARVIQPASFLGVSVLLFFLFAAVFHVLGVLVCGAGFLLVTLDRLAIGILYRIRFGAPRFRPLGARGGRQGLPSSSLSDWNASSNVSPSSPVFSSGWILSSFFVAPACVSASPPS